MKRVDAANLPLEQLFSEAASYFSTGRWDLAMKRYKQCLVVDPSNREAKANLYDIFTLQCLSPDGKDSQEFFLKATELKKRLSKDIIQK